MKDSIVTSEQHTEYLLTFLRNFETFSGIIDPDQPETSLRYKAQIDGDSYFTLLLHGTDSGQWGMILDPGYILHHAILPDLLSYENAIHLNWKVSGVNGEMLIKSEYVPEDTPPVYIAFPSELPSWSLALYHEDSGLLASLFHPEQGLFLYI